MTCSFSYPGTFNHECGAIAVIVAVKVSKPTTALYPPMQTKSGLFYSGRCAECAKEKGGDNGGVIRWEPVKGQKNEW